MVILGKENHKMSMRFCALVLIAFGILGIILMGLSLTIEVFRTDIATFQRHVGAWCGLVALMTVPFVLGLHWLIPERILLPPSR